MIFQMVPILLCNPLSLLCRNAAECRLGWLCCPLCICLVCVAAVFGPCVSHVVIHWAGDSVELPNPLVISQSPHPPQARIAKSLPVFWIPGQSITFSKDGKQNAVIPFKTVGLACMFEWFTYYKMVQGSPLKSW